MAAEALVDERRRQERYMPTSRPGGDAEQERLLRAIGKQRADLARTQVQMMLSRDEPAGLQRWASRHREAAMAALDLQTQLSIARSGGAPAAGFLSESEQRVWRRGGADEASMVALSHRRAVIQEHPDAFDTVIPLGTREARETGEVYQGSKPEPVEDLYSGTGCESRDEVPVDDSPTDPFDDSDTHDDDHTQRDDQSDGNDETEEGDPGQRIDRTERPGPNGTAATDRRRRRKAERQHHNQAQQRAGQRRKKEIREVRMMVQRVKGFAAKADQGQGKGMECGGVLMLDYFQTNLG
ncbi:MAG: hypothetical protein ABJD68_05005 [Nakamurella sp.]